MLQLFATLGLLDCRPSIPCLPEFDVRNIADFFGYATIENNPVTNDPTVPVPLTPAQLDEQYVAAELARFHSVSADEWSDPKHSSNVDPRLFSLKFAALPNTVDKYADLDAEWKRRILVEHTPRGLVYMYYWPQEQGFAYITSAQISAPVLNACAMKYTRLFRCRSLFNESAYLPPGVVGAVHTFNLALEENEKKQVVKPSYLHPKIEIDPRYTVQYKQTSRATKKSTAAVVTYSANRFKLVEKNMAYAPFLQHIPFVKPVNKTMTYAEYKAKLLADHQVDIGEEPNKDIFHGNRHILEQNVAEYTEMRERVDRNDRPNIRQRYTSRCGPKGAIVCDGDDTGSECSISSNESESERSEDESDASSFFDSSDEPTPEARPKEPNVRTLSILVPEDCCNTPFSVTEYKLQASTATSDDAPTEENRSLRAKVPKSYTYVKHKLDHPYDYSSSVTEEDESCSS